MQEDSQRNASSRSMTRRSFLNTGLKIGAATFTTGLLPRLKAHSENRYNVLFMIVDDLRPMLGCYGIEEMHTPNIDRLAERGTLFNRAYCQYPLCNPSRASILTGLRPETTKVHNNAADYEHTVPDAVDIPHYFMEQGYNTYSIGKIKHYPASTSYAGKPSWIALEVSDDELNDGITARKSENLLAEIKDELFFLALGFDKPHLPFYAPRKYFDLYNEDTFNLPTTSTYPQHAPAYAENSIDWFRIYRDIPSGDEPISDQKTLELIRAYAASTSYMDAQVGRVLRQLDDLGLTEKTVIVFCGDHGFHLGEHGTWRKNTLFEIATRSPLIISVPGQQPAQTDALTELVDIYPTLCDACELPISNQLEGLSLIPVIEEPNTPWKTGAISFLSRRGSKSYSLRTDRYRYTEWGPLGKFGYELYDYSVDPNETINVADFPEYSELLQHLRQRLRSGWKNEVPNGEKNPPIPVSIIPWDVNSDGIVDIQDLILASNSFGTAPLENDKVDVNKDGRVNIIDLLIIAAHLGESSITPAPKVSLSVLPDHVDTISEWLTEAYQIDNGSDVFRTGIANLEVMLNSVLPAKTALLPNYPNPFNPETWIPYDLAQDAKVNIKIYNLKGKTIRELNIGFQNAGSYRSRESAAYWDGRNAAGELVASGVYFCTLIADNLIATRRMTIVK